MLPSNSLLSFAVSAALASSLLAQAPANDDCGGAISVAQGANGPFTNVGATTSSAWTCASGGTDIWFVYVAPGAGSLTVDSCGGTFDSIMELFDGNAGCGALTSIGCNDDSCGVQSSVTVTVNTGDTIFIRVGGYANATGTFPLNVNGPLPAGSTVATTSTFGTGCVARPGSVYELFPTVASFDLTNTSMTLIKTGNSYLALPIGSYVPPTANATALALGDDAEIATPTLTTPFPYPGGTASTLTVCSNGFVSVASGNGTSWTPSSASMLSHSQTGWYSWHDFNTTVAGSGQIKFEEIGGVAYITWDGVADFFYPPQTPAPTNTWQLQFDETTGNVTYAWQTMSSSGSSTGGTTSQWLVGCHIAGNPLDGGSRDISATLPGTFACGPDLRALALAASARPIAGNTINLNTSNITATAPFGAITLGLSNPGFDLTAFGMPGCTQYTDALVTLLYLPFGSSTTSTAFAVPLSGIGIHIFAQSFAYDPAAALTPLGAIASNGLDLGIGNL